MLAQCIPLHGSSQKGPSSRAQDQAAVCQHLDEQVVSRNTGKPRRTLIMPFSLTYLVLGVLAVASLYIWRVTVWARDAGGYWALITGSGVAAKSAVSAAASASSIAAAAITTATSSGSVSLNRSTSIPILTFAPQKAARTAAAGKNAAAHSTSGAPADVQAQIFSLATALGVPLASLSDAIRPLIDPTVPNPVEEVKRLREQLELTRNLHEQVVQQKEEVIEEEHHKKPSVLELMEEAFLD